jgi:hypothetical protein
VEVRADELAHAEAVPGVSAMDAQPGGGDPLQAGRGIGQVVEAGEHVWHGGGYHSKAR